MSQLQNPGWVLQLARMIKNKESNTSRVGIRSAGTCHPCVRCQNGDCHPLRYPIVYNPSLAWSLGFDSDLFWSINLNLQCNETIRLLEGKITSPLDIEADSDITATRITAALSKKFLRDELELKTALIWEAESGACLIMPALVWAKNDVTVELSAGIFAGSDEGLFGQFHDNSFVRAGLKYTF